jgi:DNA polymerase-3 subunit beta
VRDLRGVQLAALGEQQQVLVAAKGLAEVQRLAGDGEIEVVLGEREVVFRTARAEVTARRIEGEFPKYEQLIPSGYPNRLIVGRDALVEALDRVQIVGQGRENAAVRLAMGTDGLELVMTAQDVGTSQESVDAKFEGSELTVAFNPAFLRDGVDAVEAAEVLLETIDPLKPATLRASDGGDFVYLLMPVRTS